MYTLRPTSRYKKDLKAMLKEGKDIKKLTVVVDKLLAGEVLDKKYLDHSLKGNWANHRECHIEPDWILIYAKNENTLVLTAVRTGHHDKSL